MTAIYKVARKGEWDAAMRSGSYAGSPDDLRDGFIHFSTGEQLAATLEKHFSNEPDLLLLTADAASLGAALRWEPSRRGELFPHLYRPLRIDEVVDIRDVNDTDRKPNPQ
ncbi:MAG: DUF952 domain-containing protein [Flavobacteriaceae bacterium]